MNFIKGIMMGSLISASAIWIYAEKTGMNKNKMMKNGKKIAKKIGIM